MLAITNSWSVKRANNRGTRILCMAKCECGDESQYMKENISRGNTTKCRACANKSRSLKKTKHGHNKGAANGGYTKTYTAWQAMKRRCHTDYDARSEHYQRRGITVCDEWINSFETFLADMGNPPTKDHSIDRIDNDGGYCKSNCRWATATEQANNKTSNRKLTVNGTTKNLCQWANISGIDAPTIRRRIGRGWTEYDAIMTDVGKKPAKC